MQAKSRKPARGGGQLNRSETVTVRLDPKLNYLCELAARSQRRTKSSLIEAALTHALTWVPVDPRPSTEPMPSISAMAEQLWHVAPAERLLRLVHYAPQLMTYDEQMLWTTIQRNAYFWLGKWRLSGNNVAVFMPDFAPQNLLVFRVEEHWETLNAVALGDKDTSALPQPMISTLWNDNLAEAKMTDLLGYERVNRSEENADA